MPTFSIVVPTYNEEEDIHETLDALVKLAFSSKEIIVVDDSTDRTPQIVETYASQGVKLVHRPLNTGGRSGARNEGIRTAAGEIVVLLNADVILPPDFLDRIFAHYQAGADYVLVDSCVKNQEHLFPRYIQSLHQRQYADKIPIEWTEGFSCRKRALLDVGLFAEGFAIPLVAGEDGVVGAKLAKTYRRKFDPTIVVYHNAPWQTSVFWKNRKERTIPYVHYFVYRMSRVEIFLRTIAKTFLGSLWILTLVPWMVHAWVSCRYSKRGLKDFFGFMWASFLEKTASIVSGWEGWFRLMTTNTTSS